MRPLLLSDLTKITQPCTLIYGAIAPLFYCLKFSVIISIMTFSLICLIDLVTLFGLTFFASKTFEIFLFFIPSSIALAIDGVEADKALKLLARLN